MDGDARRAVPAAKAETRSQARILEILGADQANTCRIPVGAGGQGQ